MTISNEHSSLNNIYTTLIYHYVGLMILSSGFVTSSYSNIYG